MKILSILNKKKIIILMLTILDIKKPRIFLKLNNAREFNEKK